MCGDSIAIANSTWIASFVSSEEKNALLGLPIFKHNFLSYTIELSIHGPWDVKRTPFYRQCTYISDHHNFQNFPYNSGPA